jgi:UDP-N-acetyl-L-fucosamine synthase
MHKQKLAIVVGTRPEIIRLSAVINKCREIFDVTLVHTGQNYDYNLNGIFFKELGIGEPDVYLDCSRDNVGKTVGDIISKSYELFVSINPDAMLIDGDTNSCLCVYSAKRLKIPIFHFEAGHRCFDLNLPEEINRKLVDHLADINICYTEHARKNLLMENCKPQYTFVVGSPIREVLSNMKDKILRSNALEHYGVTKGEYFVWSTHREENVTCDKAFGQIIASLDGLACKYNVPIFFPAHPRTKNMLDKSGIKLNKNIILSEPIGLIDYCCLQMNARCVISDSGTLTEESDILKFKGIMLRTSTEKPEGIEAGTVVIGNIDWSILEGVLEFTLNNSISNNSIPYYLPENVSDNICKIILGYIGIVNKFIWMKR